MTSSQHSPFTNDEYTVGWICALSIELAAAKGMLDEIYGQPQTPPAKADHNTYVLGSMGKFKVVIACLPIHQLGSFSAAAVAKDMLFTFPKVRVGLLVGIGAGIPNYEDGKDQDIRLGDVVMSSHPQNGGVVVYDFGKRLADGTFESLSALSRPPRSLGSALGNLRAEHEMNENKIPQYIEEMLERYPKMRKNGYSHPGQSSDRLFQFSYPHSVGGTCAQCDLSEEVFRESRPDLIPVIHYGTIASGNVVVKNAFLREEIREKHGAICLEMEAAGLMNNFPCVVIRGISDYADSHKNDRWQPFAAATAAACAKEFLEHVQPKAVDGEPTLKDIVFQVQGDVSELKSLVETVNASRNSSEIRRWLKAPDATINHNAAWEKRHAKTGMWFIDGHHFKNWMTQPNSFLWVNGFAGCGKTVLCSTAVKHVFQVKEHEQGAGVAFFCFTFDDKSKQDASAMLRALLSQLSEQLENADSELQQLHDLHKSGTPPTEALIASLERMIRRFDDVYILLDALDESPRYSRREEVITSIEKMRKRSFPGLHLLVTSRDELDIRDSLVPRDDENIVMKNPAIDKDIADFITCRLNDDSNLLKWGPYHEQIGNALAKRAQGVFRYVECQLNALKRCPLRTSRHLHKCLNTLPRDLDETYERILCSIDENFADDVRRILTILCFSARPLTVLELIDAYAVDLNNPAHLNRDDRLVDIDSLRDICLGLIEIREDLRLIDREHYLELLDGEYEGPHDQTVHIVHIAHFSVQEYLLSGRIQQAKAANFALQSGPSHAAIAKICLVYLLEPMLYNADLPSKRLEEFPLAQFAAEYWFHHHEKSQDRKAQVQTLVTELFKGYKRSFKNWLRFLDSSTLFWKPDLLLKGDRDDKATPLYYASRLGLDCTLQDLIYIAQKDGTRFSDILNAKCGHLGSALHVASFNGHDKVVQILLDNGADINSENDRNITALHAASSKGHEKVVQILLDNSADLNTKDYRQITALHAASSQGHDKVVQILLDNGADVDTKDYRQITALHAASSKGHEKVVQILLDNSADVNTKDNRHITALHSASSQGHDKVVQILLDNGADVNTKNYRHITALHAASSKGHEKVVQILLDNSADVNTKDDRKITALHAASSQGHEMVFQLLLAHGANGAAYRGHAKVVKLLLERGADINAEGETSGSALQVTSREGHKNVVQMLLERGADAKAHCGECGKCTAGCSKGRPWKGGADAVRAGADMNAQGEISGSAPKAALSKAHKPEIEHVLDLEPFHNLVHDSSVCCVRFSCDGKYLATGCDRSAHIFDVITGQKLLTFPNKQIDQDGEVYISSVCFSLDGKILATCGEEEQIRTDEFSDGSPDPRGGWETALDWLFQYCEGEYISAGADFGWPVTATPDAGATLVRHTARGLRVSRHPLPVGGPQFNRFIHSELGRALLALTGTDVPFVCSKIKGRQIAKCIRMPGHFGGCCGNCKFPDQADVCSVRDSGGRRNGTSRGNNPPANVPTQGQLVLGSVSHPISVDDDDREIIEID
ncbi:hypothetical protein N7467_005029 [Penicillium canescens]|nr:hypothetical protein N7467_005029 [Penicillium canescens]